MSILFLIIPLSLVLVGLAVWAFVWAVNHDQFEDLDRAASSILFDDDLESPHTSDPDESRSEDDEGEPKDGASEIMSEEEGKRGA